MSKSLLTIILTLLLGMPLWAQDQAAGDVEAPADAGETAADSGDAEATSEEDEVLDAIVEEELAQIVDPEFDDAALDDQTYDEDDDDFVPSEEIPADEPIPFPSNI